MYEIAFNALNKFNLSFKYQRNIFFSIGTILVTAGTLSLNADWKIIALGIFSEEVLNKPLDNYDIIIGAVLILLGFYSIYIGWVSLKITNHDQPKYDELRKVVDFDKTRMILSQIRTNKMYSSNQSTHLHNVQNFLEKPENHFLTRSIKSSANKLSKLLDEYYLFLASNFFVYPKNQVNSNPTYSLQPGLDINKDLQNYDSKRAEKLEALSKELVKKTEQVEITFEELIIKAKSKLGK